MLVPHNQWYFENKSWVKSVADIIGLASTMKETLVYHSAADKIFLNSEVVVEELTDETDGYSCHINQTDGFSNLKA
jgi:hypothetical protein